MYHLSRILVALLTVTVFAPASAMADPETRIRLPERFRLLVDQRFDLRIEARGLTGQPTLQLLINGLDVSGTWPAAEMTQDNDADPDNADRAWTFRGVSLLTAGVTTIDAIVTDQAGTSRASTRVGVQHMDMTGAGRSVVLFIGDAFGTTYRDAARVVAGSVDNGFREGFFDRALAMDAMPVSGMVLTHSLNGVVPDSANTAAAWSMGNKTISGALAALPDNTDWRFVADQAQATKAWALDNPRVETLWQYLKRRHGYRTGIVSTADLTDATPAAAGSHSIRRALGYDIARQFVDGSFTPGPVFDVMLGGGKERFASRSVDNSGDTRDFPAELRQKGYTYVETRRQLNDLLMAQQRPAQLLGLFRTGNMNVAYDKLGLTRPADEPVPDFAGFTDQPFLAEMTRAALEVLARDNQPFILLVEGASIDKQSHPNHAAGVIWDAIELDHAVDAGRQFATSRRGTRSDPLLLVSADHDQSMHIIGVVDTTVDGVVENVRFGMPYPPDGKVWRGGVSRFPDYSEHADSGYPANDNRYRLAVGFRTGGHTGSAVPLTAEGPGALLFTGYYDQTDIFFKVARVIGADDATVEALGAALRKMSIVGPDY